MIVIIFILLIVYALTVNWYQKSFRKENLSAIPLSAGFSRNPLSGSSLWLAVPKGFKNTYCAMQDENAIKKAPKKPWPTAKWLDTYSTPVSGFAVASNKSNSILTQLAIDFQGLLKNFWPPHPFL